MLLTLGIKNFLIVESIEIDFQSGMSVFTGETGAGKSIMFDALMFLLGAQMDTSIIRLNTFVCELVGSFEVLAGSPAHIWLQSQDMVIDNELIIRRTIHREGRSKSYINGQLVSVQKVKELALLLVHIHGQHQHQTLFRASTQRIQLDNYAGHAALLADVVKQYEACRVIEDALHQLTLQDEQEDKKQLLQFKLDELRSLNLASDDIEKLNQEHQLLHHANQYLKATDHIQNLLNQEDGPSAYGYLYQAIDALKGLPINTGCLKNAYELLNNAVIEIEEAIGEIALFYDQIVLDPSRLQAVEERLALLHQMARKYRISLQALPEELIKIEQAYLALDVHAQRKAQLETDYALALTAYNNAAEKLHISRMKAAEVMGREITAIIQQLGMPEGIFEVRVTASSSVKSHGQDDITYYVKTNAGMAMNPLVSVVSGGELSRISLAIEVISKVRTPIPTLLFDEVDAGVGGATAALVGRLLKTLSDSAQIFCVTHAPQIAAAAHHQFLVKKSSVNEVTYTTVHALSSDNRVNEIARMLGGLTITDHTKAHAKELLESCAAPV